jgi:hypothetical protein
MPLRVTACDIGLGPRRLLLWRAYVRTGDPVRSLPRVVCVFGAEREEDASQSFCSVTDPRGTPACLRPSRTLLHRVEASSGDDTRSMLSRAARPPLSRPPRATVSRSSCREPTVSRRPTSRWWSSPAEATFPLGVFHGCLSASASIARERSPPRFTCVLSLRMRS